MDNVQFPKIALGFSGGGYRAASFSLGTLSYLNSVRLNGGKSLLECVVMVSTVSGGTITGLAYTYGIKQGKSFEEIYNHLYTQMSNTDLVNLALNNLIDDKKWNETRIRSLINAIADVYDERLFNGAKFGELMADENPIHLKHFSFNATEFATALQFRFQHSEKSHAKVLNENERGIIGNKNFNVPFNIAKHIRLADILASSSCFPGGFEPINFPTDFMLPDIPELKALVNNENYPVGLMDGGIVDNQGIEPLLLAEGRMKRNELIDDPAAGKKRVIDVLMICDVVSPYMDDYKVSTQKPLKGWRRLTPAMLLTLNTILLVIAGAGLFYAFSNRHFGLAVFSTVILTSTVMLFIIGRIIKGLPKKMGVPKAFMKPLGKLLKMKLLVYENLLSNRLHSVSQLINDLFLKHMRNLNYDMIYNDDSWKNRRIMNSIYELDKGEPGYAKKLKEGKITADLVPSEAIQEIAGKARSMGTTLWFSAEELEKKGQNKMNMLDTLIACGQFTTCWNLLEYVMNLKKDSTNTSPGHNTFLACEQQLREDWEKFQADPFWLVLKTAT